MFTESEIQSLRGEITRGIDANHTPRLVVPEVYIERKSRRLQALAAQALLDSHIHPDTQFDVVWLGESQGRFLRATIQPTGTFNLGDGTEWGYPIEGTTHRYVPDISEIQVGIGSGYSYGERFDQAIRNGAGVFKPADLGRDF